MCLFLLPCLFHRRSRLRYPLAVQPDFSLRVPLIIVFRALSHVIFVLTGALILKKKQNVLGSVTGAALFGFLMAVIHAAGEIAAVTLFYLGSDVTKLNDAKGFAYSILLLVGVGTIVHSMVDFGISLFVWRPLTHVIRFPVSARFVLKKSSAK